MKEKESKILVIMPVYNTEKFVYGAIESVLQQTHKNLHLVIIDDGSTDGSLDVIKKYEDNERVTILQNKENKGCYYSRNRGLMKLDDSYDFFTIHDSDDMSDTNRFKIILNDFNEYGEKLLGMKTSYMRVDENLDPIVPHDVYASEGIAVYRRQVHDILGFYDNTKFGGDTDFWERLELYCRWNEEYKLAEGTDVLYLALSRTDGNNLTKKYNFGTGERQQYMQKFRGEISRMKTEADLYRGRFS